MADSRLSPVYDSPRRRPQNGPRETFVPGKLDTSRVVRPIRPRHTGIGPSVGARPRRPKEQKRTPPWTAAAYFVVHT